MKGKHKHAPGYANPVLGSSLWEGTGWLRRLGAGVVAVMLMGALPVLAATVDISIALETIVRGRAGSTHVLAVVDVPQESIGGECDVTVVARNQDSEHPDSNLVISSATSVEILDVENTAYGTVFGAGLITLADSVTVTLTLGADKVFSGGLDVEIDCPPFNPTTTTTTTQGAGGTTDSSGGAGGTTDSSGGAGGTTDSSGGAQDTTNTSVLGTAISAAGSSAAEGSETLPFTGLPEGSAGGVAIAFLALGGLLLLSIRRRETDAIVTSDWRTRVDFYNFHD